MSAREQVKARMVGASAWREEADALLNSLRDEVLAEAVALIEAARANDEAMYYDEPARINRRIGMREAMAVLRLEYEPEAEPSRRPHVQRPAVHGKDTGGAVQALAGESTQAAPDLLSIVTGALSTGQGPLLPLPTVTQRILAARVTDAVTPLVAYRPVWDSSLPPGGRVCSVCGEPVESEPCREHAPVAAAAAPDFFQPGRTYQRRRWLFQCLAVAPSPLSGVTSAVGFLYRPGEPATATTLDPDDWAQGGWTEATEGEGGRD